MSSRTRPPAQTAPRVVAPGRGPLAEYQHGTDPHNPDTDYDGRIDGQEVLMDGTNPLDPTSFAPVRLALWRFNSLTWMGEQGQMPLNNRNLAGALVPGVEGDAVSFTNAGSRLSYREYDQALANFNLRHGTVRFWFAPTWSSVSQGGNGPGTIARLLNVGAWNTNSASGGDWFLALNPAGDQITLGTQDNAGHTIQVPWGVIPGGLVASQWHQFAATFSPTSATVFVDGTAVASNAGLNNIYPPTAVRALGYSLGTDGAGAQSSLGAYDLWDSYNYPLAATQIGVYTNQSISGNPVLNRTINVPNPVDVKWTAGNNLFVLSGTTATLTQYATNGTVVRQLAGLGSNPQGFDVDTNGLVFVALAGSHQIASFVPTGTSFTPDLTFGTAGRLGGFGAAPGQFDSPASMAVSPDTSTIWVADTGNNRVQQFTAAGSLLVSIGGPGIAYNQYARPQGVGYSEPVKSFVADTANNRVLKLQGYMVYKSVGRSGNALGKFNSPMKLSISDTCFYVADTGNNRIQTLDTGTLAPLNSFGPNFGLLAPQSVAVAGDLTQERLYVADTGNNRILVITIPKADPLAVWTAARQALQNGNFELALSYFSASTVDGYRAMFNALGPAQTSQKLSAAGSLMPLSIDDVEARYLFSVTLSGQVVSFEVAFANEMGLWKIKHL